jgi:hypothetical protein
MKLLIALMVVASTPVMAAEPATATPAVNVAADLQPAINTSAAAPAAAASARPRAAVPVAATAAVGKARDRIELETTQITGNRELPKVLYVVPWKRSDLGDLTGRPVNSLLDEVLTPVDRDVFRRQNRYYEALKPDAASPKSGAAQ